MNSFGRFFRITTFGESHGPQNGVVIEGVPAGLPLDRDFISLELTRRRPSGDSVSTSRIEADEFQIVSGLNGLMTNGAPLAILIPNCAQNSADYEPLRELYRPGHGDYGWFEKYGQAIGAGGGRLSGRETVARVAAGAVAKLLLKQCGVTVRGYTSQIGPVDCGKVDWSYVEQNPYRVPDKKMVPQIDSLITLLRQRGDSVGGRLHLEAQNVPAGWGSPVFDKLEAQIGAAMFSIGAVKGLLFGAAEEYSCGFGSVMNDYQTEDGRYLTNNSGGIIGGLSNGAPIAFDLIIKAPPSIAMAQPVLDKDGKIREVTLSGRHDRCLCPRIVPVAEAMLALVLADAYLESTLPHKWQNV